MISKGRARDYLGLMAKRTWSMTAGGARSAEKFGGEAGRRGIPGGLFRTGIRDLAAAGNGVVRGLGGPGSNLTAVRAPGPTASGQALTRPSTPSANRL